MSETPAPSDPWIVIDSPLIVFPDGSWGLLISIVALAVSGLTLWHTLSARPRIHPFVVRNYLQFGNAVHADADGDEVVISNLGRTAAIIYDVRAIDGKGGHLKTAAMPRGHDQVGVPYPEMPQSLAPGGVLKIWFSTSLAGEEAGKKHGYLITYANSSVRRRVRTTPQEMIAKATDDPAPKASGFRDLHADDAL
ncbi:hypothetical protein [Microbacterium sp. NPDC087665]|uniref:hypothetical protein n=1 Tax=Microbacterium sp. NPDC087665 TaxID=3364194 RepID=UPI003817D118